MVIDLALAVVLMFATMILLRRLHYCGERDYLRRYVCTAHVLGRQEHKHDDPRHVWTAEEWLSKTNQKIYQHWPGPRFERLRAMYYIVAKDHAHHDGGGWLRRYLVVRAWLTLLFGRVRSGFPYECGMAWEMGSWNSRTWSGYEQTCWEADFCYLCTGRNWHVHLCTEGGP